MVRRREAEGHLKENQREEDPVLSIKTISLMERETSVMLGIHKEVLEVHKELREVNIEVSSEIMIIGLTKAVGEAELMIGKSLKERPTEQGEHDKKQAVVTKEFQMQKCSAALSKKDSNFIRTNC